MLTLEPLTISPTQGSLLNFPRTKALQSGRCMWQMGRGCTQPERWRKQFSAPSPTSYRNSPSGLQTPEASPTLSLTLSPGLPRNRQGGGATLPAALCPTAGWSPDPQGPSRLPPSHRRAPARHSSTNARDSERTQPFLPAYRTRASAFPNPALPAAPPLARDPPLPRPPAHRVLPTPQSAGTRTSHPAHAGSPCAPTFSRPGPGPRSGRDSAPGAATAGRARVSLAPARPARTSCARDPLGFRASAVSPGGGAGAAGTALSWRPHSRPPSGAGSPRPPRRRAPLTSSRAAAATAGKTWQGPPPLARLASPLLSSPRPRSCLRSAGPQRQAPSAAGKPHLLALTLTPRRPRRGRRPRRPRLPFPGQPGSRPRPSSPFPTGAAGPGDRPARPAPGSPLAASGEPAPTTELLSASSPGSRAAGAEVIPG